MAAKLEIGIVYDEKINTCRVSWESFNTNDFPPMEKSTLEQLKMAIINQLNSGINNSKLH
ncbi:hypothetical protein [Xenorhabdus sp. Sc-CR9]|uniref:hypothetical protein n=1 Tax=Xenorhabdus sp. Sc-CR9 TaxID=2584468 RepID=UPI001F358ACC|nr:hypothetical protein [Xenorhabdus sp. Sc-CR9]